LIHYLDTSAIVAALTNETAGERVIRWIETNGKTEFAISEWVVAEFSSALATKMRIGALDEMSRTEAFGRFARMRQDSLRTLAFETTQFQAAAQFADQYALGLRASDALHLAICARHGAAMCTLDDRLAKAGPAVGVATIRL
jgi:predicted nucleic acid-binding protein